MTTNTIPADAWPLNAVAHAVDSSGGNFISCRVTAYGVASSYASASGFGLPEGTVTPRPSPAEAELRREVAELRTLIQGSREFNASLQLDAVVDALEKAGVPEGRNPAADVGALAAERDELRREVAELRGEVERFTAALSSNRISKRFSDYAADNWPMRRYELGEIVARIAKIPADVVLTK